MLPIRAQVSTFAPSAARLPMARDSKTNTLQASFSNARDLSNQVHHWYMAARRHLAEAHHCDQQIVRLQNRMSTMERTLGRASPIMVGAGAPLLGFGEVIHAGAVSHGAMGLLAAGLAMTLAWVGGTAGIKRRIDRLTHQCASAQDQIQNYTRLAEALDPDRTPPRARPVPARGLLQELRKPAVSG